MSCSFFLNQTTNELVDKTRGVSMMKKSLMKKLGPALALGMAFSTNVMAGPAAPQVSAAERS